MRQKLSLYSTLYVTNLLLLGCEQTFTNMSTLYMHMKKVHRKDEIESEPAGTDQTRGGVDSGENIYLVRK